MVEPQYHDFLLVLLLQVFSHTTILLFQHLRAFLVMLERFLKDIFNIVHCSLNIVPVFLLFDWFSTMSDGCLKQFTDLDNKQYMAGLSELHGLKFFLGSGWILCFNK